MGSQNSSNQIKSFSFVACNGRGLRFPTNPVWTTVENNLGAFRVIQSRNKCSDPKLALDRAISFLEKYRKLGHMKGHLYFFLQVGNKTDTRLLWFSVIIKKDNWKIIKKGLLLSINFTTSLRFEKIVSYLSNKSVFRIFEKKVQKMGFSICFFLKIGWCFILSKKKLKKWVSYSSFFENFWC